MLAKFFTRRNFHRYSVVPSHEESAMPAAAQEPRGIHQHRIETGPQPKTFLWFFYPERAKDISQLFWCLFYFILLGWMIKLSVEFFAATHSRDLEQVEPFPWDLYWTLRRYPCEVECPGRPTRCFPNTFFNSIPETTATICLTTVKQWFNETLDFFMVLPRQLNHSALVERGVSTIEATMLNTTATIEHFINYCAQADSYIRQIPCPNTTSLLPSLPLMSRDKGLFIFNGGVGIFNLMNDHTKKILPCLFTMVNTLCSADQNLSKRIDDLDALEWTYEYNSTLGRSLTYLFILVTIIHSTKVPTIMKRARNSLRNMFFSERDFLELDGGASANRLPRP